VIPDPVPTELTDAGFTADDVAAYDAAWPACQDLLVVDASVETNQPLRLCLADQLGVPDDDTHLLAFMTWVVAYESDPEP
jgi:hypothetical protein